MEKTKEMRELSEDIQHILEGTMPASPNASRMCLESADALVEVNKGVLSNNVTQKTMDIYINNTIGFWMDNAEFETIYKCFQNTAPHKFGIKWNLGNLPNWKRFYLTYGERVRDMPV